MTSPHRIGISFGSLPAATSRLKATRNRLAGLITQTLIDESRDCSHWGTTDPDFTHERTTLERAREVLLASPPIRETRDEVLWRVEARKDFARLEGERTHGEPFVTTD